MRDHHDDDRGADDDHEHDDDHVYDVDHHVDHSTSTVALQPTVTVSYTPTVDPLFCSVVIDLTDFGASQSYDVTLVHSSPTLTNPASPWTFSNVPTDAAGTAHFVAFSYFQGLPEDASFTASANGISSDTVNVSC